MREHLLQKEYTLFDDTFQQNYQEFFLHPSLVLFVDMALQRTSINKNNYYFQLYNMTMPQLIVQNSVKRKRKEAFSAFCSKTKEFPQSIYIGMLLLAETRENGLVNKFFDLDISVTLFTSSGSFN